MGARVGSDGRAGYWRSCCSARSARSLFCCISAVGEVGWGAAQAERMASIRAGGRWRRGIGMSGLRYHIAEVGADSVENDPSVMAGCHGGILVQVERASIL